MFNFLFMSNNGRRRLFRKRALICKGKTLAWRSIYKRVDVALSLYVVLVTHRCCKLRTTNQSLFCTVKCPDTTRRYPQCCAYLSYHQTKAERTCTLSAATSFKRKCFLIYSVSKLNLDDGWHSGDVTEHEDNLFDSDI